MRCLSSICLALLVASPLLAKPQPQRIIALAPHLTELVYALGAEQRLIAVMEHSDYPEAALDLPVVGNYQNINIEKILTLKPDLILSWPEGNPNKQLDQLDALGVKLLPTNPGRLDQLPEFVITLANELGVPERGERLAAQLEQRYQALTEFAEHHPVRVFYQIWHQPLMTVGNNSWLDDAIKLCGGVNIFADSKIPYPQVGLEQVLARKPQAVILSDHKGSDAPWRQWSQLEVVKQEHLFELDPDLMNRYTPRLLDGTAQMCQALDKVRHSNSL